MTVKGFSRKYKSFKVQKYFTEAEEPEKEGEEEKAVSKVVSLSGKVRRRMYTRAMRDMQAVQKRSKETLEKLHFTVDLVRSCNKQFDKTHFLLQSIDKLIELSIELFTVGCQ